jgi:transposase-like protein
VWARLDLRLTDIPPSGTSPPKVTELMNDAKVDVVAFSAFPADHWRKIWSNNPLERLNKEIKRSQLDGHARLVAT